MKKILIIPILLLVLSSCNKDTSNLNIDTKHASTAPSYALFSNAERNLADVLATPNVNINIFQLITQQWTEVTYVDESNYDIGTRNISNNWWRAMYKTVLINLEAAKARVPKDVDSANVQKNDLAMIDIMEVFTWQVLVNTYGDIPYTEALNPDNFFPKYDDAKTVYYDLLNRLDTSIAALDPSAASFGGADLIYGGDIAEWQKFANSLKLNMGMIIADSDPAKAKSVVESAAPNVFASNADNAVFTYLPATPNVNPVWTNLVQSGRNDYVPSKTIVDLMNTLNDPRRPEFFTTIDGAYKGGTVGIGNSFSSYSHPSDKVEQPDFPYVFLSYSQIEFDLAEAAARGFNVVGTAAEHYTTAIQASLDYWGVSATDAAAYLAQPSVAYLTAPGSYKQKIGTQEYISLYMDGFDAWTVQRRLDYPALVAPPTAQSAFPVRFTYPVSEQNLNSQNWTAASSAIGGDKVDTKLWWDMN